MRLPTQVFLGAFAFTFFLRLLRPNIGEVRDGIGLGCRLPLSPALIVITCTWGCPSFSF
jgi:hypothetical protein